MSRRLRFILLASFEFIIMTAVAVSGGIFSSYILSESAKNISHTNEVIDQIDKTFIVVLRAESSVKSYIALGTQEYIDYFNELRAEYPYDLGDLRYLIQDNPVQRGNFVDFTNAVQEKYKFLQYVLKLHEDNKLDEVKDKIAGKKYMDRITEIYKKMKNEEYRLLEIRVKKLENRINLIKYLVPVLNLANFIMIILVSSSFINIDEK